MFLKEFGLNMRLLGAFSILIISIFLWEGCSLSKSDVVFETIDSTPIVLREVNSLYKNKLLGERRKLKGNNIDIQHGIYETVFFVLHSPVQLTISQSLAVEISNDLNGFIIELYNELGELVKEEKVNIGGSGKINYSITIQDPFLLKAFRLRCSECDSGRLSVFSARVIEQRHTLYVNNLKLVSNNNWKFQSPTEFNGTGVWPVELKISGLIYEKLTNQNWLLALRVKNSESENLQRMTILLSNSTQEILFTNDLKPGVQYIHLHYSNIGFYPTNIKLDMLSGQGTLLQAIAIERMPNAEPITDIIGIAADLRQILDVSTYQWRQSEFEIFLWNAPRVVQIQPILILDAKNVQILELFFRRLAFFVEKSGYRGELLTNKQLMGLRGYNAHDYSSKDLARFYNLAQQLEIELNSHEDLLRRILVNHGLITLDVSGDWSSGGGAILGFSRSSTSSLRQLLLFHEVLHGLYFTHEKYQQSVSEVWNELPKESQIFWIRLLTLIGYDTNYQSLIENEFQAYILQQNMNQLSGFLSLWAGRLGANFPTEKQLFIKVANQKEFWVDIHQQLNFHLESLTGNNSEELILLHPSLKK